WEIPPPIRLEIELVDVFPGEPHRRAKKNLIADDLLLAEAARVQAGVARLQLSRRNGMRCVDGQVAEIDRVPEDDGLHRPAIDELRHVFRRGEPDDGNLPALPGAVHRLRHARES